MSKTYKKLQATFTLGNRSRTIYTAFDCTREEFISHLDEMLDFHNEKDKWEKLIVKGWSR